jgi:hypothetical protein
MTMRISTKIKRLLLDHKLEVDIDDHKVTWLTAINKTTGEVSIYEGKSFSDVVHKSYRVVIDIRNEKAG